MDEIRIELTINGTVHDVSHLLKARSLTVAETSANSKFKSSLDTASFTLVYDASFVSSFMAATGKVPIRIHADGAQVFSGVLDPVFSLSWVAENPVDHSFEAVDFTYVLDHPVSRSLAFPEQVDGEPFWIFKRDDLEHSILYKLLDLAGLADVISLTAQDIPKKVRHFSVEEKAATYRKLIDDLGTDYDFVIRGTGQGLVAWHKTAIAEESLILVPELTESDILSKQSGKPLTIVKRYEDYDGVEITWPKTKVYDDALLWRGNLPVGDTSDPTPGEAIAAGDYWPEDSDIIETWQKYGTEYLDLAYLSGQTRLKNDDIALIASSDQYIKDTKDDEVALDPIEPGVATVVYESLRAQLRYKNAASSVKKLYWSEIYGKALVRIQEVETTYPTNCLKPLEQPAAYIYDDEEATRLSGSLWARISKGIYDVSFNSLRLFEFGECRKIAVSSSGYFGWVMITGRSRTYDFSGKYTYNAVSVSPFELVVPVHKARQGGGAAKPGKDGSVPEIEWALSASKDTHPVVNSLFMFGTKYIAWGEKLIGYMPWTDKQLIPTNEKPYLWLLSRISGGVWTYVCMTGASAVSVTLSASLEAIPFSSRGIPRVTSVVFTVITDNILIGSISPVWMPQDGSLTVAEDHMSAVFDTKKLVGDTATIAVTVSYAGKTYARSKVITKIIDGKPAAANLGALSSLPVAAGSEPLISGDYFLSQGFEQDEKTYKKGAVYEYLALTGEWNVSPNSGKNLSVLADFLDLKVDTESEVFNNIFGRKFSSWESFVQFLYVVNGTFGTGDGTAGSGFRFRAMTHGNGDGTGSPVFDIYDGDDLLLAVDIPNHKIYFGDGFSYSAVDKTIRSKGDKVVIDASGKMITHELEAIDALLTNGLFTGLFQTPSIFTEPSPQEEIIHSVGATGIQQAAQLSASVSGTAIGSGGAYTIIRRVSTALNAAAYWIKCTVTYTYYSNIGDHRDWKFTVQFLTKEGGVIAGIGGTTQVYRQNTNPVEYQRGTAISASAFSVTQYTGGDILRVDIPQAPSSSEISTMASGQVYRDENGFLKCTVI